MFVDEVIIKLIAGKGGDGCRSFIYVIICVRKEGIFYVC